MSGGGGLAGLLWQEGGAANTVVELGDAGSLGVYRKEVTEGEHNKQQSNQSITKCNMAIRGARGDLTQG